MSTLPQIPESKEAAGVLLVPTLVTFLWFSIMGGTALWEQRFGGGTLIDAEGGVDQNIALFQMLELLPGTAVLAGVAIVLIVVFFVTSSDSGSFVIDMISHGGSSTPPVWSRVMWSLLEGTIAAVVLLAAGDALGLRALQVLAILVAAPWSVVMIVMCVATARALGSESKRTMQLERAAFRREMLEEIRDEEQVGTALEHVETPLRR